MICLVASSAWVNADPGDDLVQVKVVANVSAMKPGEPFTAGVNLKIAPGWHVYWINPGDAGEAPHVNWTLPTGFTVSDLKFPVPERIVSPGDIISYGYQNEVTLTATITPPKDLKLAPEVKGGATVELSAAVDWLVCEKVCLPGHGQASVTVWVADKAVPESPQIFLNLWLPDRPTGTVSAEAKPLDLSSGQGQTEIRLSAEASGELEVFPYPLNNVSISLGKVRKDGNVSIIPVSASVLPGQNVSVKTWNVLVVSRTKPNRFAYDVPITIVNK